MCAPHGMLSDSEDLWTNHRTKRGQSAGTNVSRQDADRSVPATVPETVRGSRVSQRLAERKTRAASLPIKGDGESSHREFVGCDHLQPAASHPAEPAAATGGGAGLKPDRSMISDRDLPSSVPI